MRFFSLTHGRHDSDGKFLYASVVIRRLDGSVVIRRLDGSVHVKFAHGKNAKGLFTPKTRVFSAAEILLRKNQNPIHLNGTR